VTEQAIDEMVSRYRNPQDPASRARRRTYIREWIRGAQSVTHENPYIRAKFEAAIAAATAELNELTRED
jgi:hypothetical protein